MVWDVALSSHFVLVQNSAAKTVGVKMGGQRHERSWSG
jgi:hypothetical protein